MNIVFFILFSPSLPLPYHQSSFFFLFNFFFLSKWARTNKLTPPGSGWGGSFKGTNKDRDKRKARGRKGF